MDLYFCQEHFCQSKRERHFSVPITVKQPKQSSHTFLKPKPCNKFRNRIIMADIQSVSYWFRDVSFHEMKPAPDDATTSSLYVFSN